MLFNPGHCSRLDQLAERLRVADTVTPELVANVIDEACPRLNAVNGAPRRIALLIGCRAWTEAALALVALQLPQWKLRRLASDGGEWHCRLSRHQDLPDGLDDAVESHHENMALAILTALVEAQVRVASTSGRPLRVVPEIPANQLHAVCCDNFA